MIKSKIIMSQDKDQFNLIKFIKLTNFREIYINNYFYQPNLKKFTEILKLTKKLSDEKNSKLYFIYVPEYYRYIGFKSKKLHQRNKIIKIVKNLDIAIIDLHQNILEKMQDPLKLYPFRKFGHFNEFGYDFVSKIIYEKLSN